MELTEFEDKNYKRRININISSESQDIINRDIHEFMVDETKHLSSFLNVIFRNFYEDADASISTRVSTRENELRKLFNIKKKSNEETEQIILKLKEEYSKLLVAKVVDNKNTNKTKYKKETKFRLDDNNFDIMLHSEDVKHPHYKERDRVYLNALFEEYARLSSFRRECIFFKKHIDTINIAKKINNCMISILTKNKKTIIINPYKIYSDNVKTSAYIVGTKERDNKLFVMRLKNIINISLIKNKPIDIENFNTIDDTIKEHGIAYVNGKFEEYKIKLSDQGKILYNITLNSRPQVTSIEDDIYTFLATEFQIENYFFRFGKDALIISPESTKEKFINKHKEALNSY